MLRQLIPALLLFTITSAHAATLTLKLELARAVDAPAIRIDVASLATGSVTTHEEPLASADRLGRLNVAPGAYELTISAPHHRSITRHIVVAEEGAALGAIRLEALPRITGSVTSADGKPLAGATIATPNGERVQSDAAGTFALEVDRLRPEHLIVSYPKRGTRAVAVPAGDAGVALRPVALGEASSLDVIVKRGRVRATTLEVQLALRDGGTMRSLFRRKLAAGESRIAFTDLASGSYRVIVRGDGPLQQAATPFVLGTGERRKGEVKLAPSTARVRVTLGDKPLAGAILEATNTDHDWKTVVRTDANGLATEELWQAGSFMMNVRADAMTAPYVHTSVVEAAPEVDWRIALPDRRIGGRIVDAATGAAVAEAIVLLKTESGTEKTIVQTTSGADGRFAYRAVLPGKQTIEVRAGDYLFPASPVFELTKENASHELELRLERGAPAEVLVLDAAGAPLPGTRIFSAAGEELRSRAITADDGRAVVPLTASGTSVLYVIPRDGSFAVLRADAAAVERSGTLRVTVPAAKGSLQVVTKRTDGAPVGGVRLLVRYNGELVPAEVVRTVERTRGVRFTTDDGGVATIPELPLGIYELWPYRTDREADALRASATLLAAPVQLTLKTGENVVLMSFAAK